MIECFVRPLEIHSQNQIKTCLCSWHWIYSGRDKEMISSNTVFKHKWAQRSKTPTWKTNYLDYSLVSWLVNWLFSLTWLLLIFVNLNNFELKYSYLKDQKDKRETLRLVNALKSMKMACTDFNLLPRKLIELPFLQ